MGMKARIQLGYYRLGCGTRNAGICLIIICLQEPWDGILTISRGYSSPGFSPAPHFPFSLLCVQAHKFPLSPGAVLISDTAHSQNYLSYSFVDSKSHFGNFLSLYILHPQKVLLLKKKSLPCL